MNVNENDQNMKVAIVILNYQNSRDSLACVRSISKQNYHELAGVLVVDNGSSEDNFKILKDSLGERKEVFSLIRLRKNLGFARGNNVGICYARRKWNTDYILIVNNDTLFTDPDMLSKLLAHRESDVAMIGPAIRLKNGYIQKEYTSITRFPFLAYRYLSFWAESLYCNSLCERMQTKWNQKELQQRVLHGCALLFTPVFFKYYLGIYSKTFLYSEEEILWFQLQKVGLKQCYVPETEIFHLEDQSTNLSFKDVERGTLRYHRKSAWHAMIAKILPYNILKRMC
ncbi:MAG: glycosyltransferase family 2 protein [Lachnospiraceae bacterium]|nr:glycosyltransferase family 2 protein [Lachnospiraceae bacterium]